MEWCAKFRTVAYLIFRTFDEKDATTTVFWELCNIFQNFYIEDNLQPSASEQQTINSVSQDNVFYQNSLVKTVKYQTPVSFSQNMLNFISDRLPNSLLILSEFKRID